MSIVSSQRSRIALWLTAVAFVIVLQFWWIPGQTYRASDSYSTMSDGKLGLFRVLERLFPEVTREADSLIPKGTQTMILVDPPTDLDSSTRFELNKFVSHGGTLVFAPGIESDIGPYNEFGFDLMLHDSNIRSKVSVTGPIVEGTRTWESNRKIKTRPYFSHTDLLTDTEGGVHATAIELGRGTVVACSGPEAFSNKAMLDPERAETAVRLIEYAHSLNTKSNRNTAGIVICERMNDARTGDVWGILLGPALRHGSLQIVIIGLLVAWLGYEQFGPHRKRGKAGRKSLTDSAEALGNLQFRTKNGAQIVERYFEYVAMNARRSSGQLANLHSLDWLAARTGLPIEEVKTQMARIGNVLKSGSETPSNVSSIIRWLAIVQQRLLHPQTKRKK